MYKDLDPDEFDCLRFIAVNENIPKEWDETRFPNVIKEWELPTYDPKWQEEKLGQWWYKSPYNNESPHNSRMVRVCPI